MSASSDSDRVRRYHDATKHHFHRFARSAGYLDWATQPDPFRRYDGAEPIDLVAALRRACAPIAGARPAWLATAYDGLFTTPAQPRLPAGLGAVSVLLRYSLGLSAWKQGGGHRWSLRVNPSSGNLHPTEAYVILGPDAGVAAAGVFHYRPDTHALELRCQAPAGAWDALASGLPPGAFFAAFTSIHWREAWKYGERAFRYCQHDTGHAIAAVRLAAAMIGWHARLVPQCSADALGRLLGVDREDRVADAEPEDPECLLVVSPRPCPDWTPDLPQFATAVAGMASGIWHGRASVLSPSRVSWEAIDLMAGATRAPGIEIAPAARHAAAMPDLARRPESQPRGEALPASRVILQRRSAVAMTGGGSLSLDRLIVLLRRLRPGPSPPFDALWWEPRLHLVLFVHRVTGLEPGLYAFLRTPAALDRMRAALRPDFAWIRPPGVPDDLPLFLLVPLDVRRIAAVLACHQAIAADGVLSAAMLAEFDAALEAEGAWFYRHLFWEAGAVGQMLYLEAEASGLRGTGIGCFYDDAVHDLLGMTDHRWQSLYHFTIGEAEPDDRLQTEPGYGWDAGGE